MGISIGFAQFASRIADANGNYTKCLNELQNLINAIFRNSDYGTGLIDLTIAVVCMENWDYFYPVKSRYILAPKVYNTPAGPMVFERCLEFRIKLDETSFPFVSYPEAVKQLCDALRAAMPKAIRAPKKLVDFDKEAFIHDFDLALDAFMEKVAQEP